MPYRTLPEPPTDPPEDVCCIAGGCGHEVYEGEHLIEWHDGRKYIFLCGECFRDKLAEMTTEELARQFGCACTTVRLTR